jgi:hypothetical protein
LAFFHKDIPNGRRDLAWLHENVRPWTAASSPSLHEKHKIKPEDALASIAEEVVQYCNSAFGDFAVDVFFDSQVPRRLIDIIPRVSRGALL